jgi:hypothetical protein
MLLVSEGIDFKELYPFLYNIHILELYSYELINYFEIIC